MGFNAKDLMEAGRDADSEHASDTGCLKCELDYRHRVGQLTAALMVLTKNKRTSFTIASLDPKGLEQAEIALVDAGDEDAAIAFINNGV